MRKVRKVRKLRKLRQFFLSPSISRNSKPNASSHFFQNRAKCPFSPHRSDCSPRRVHACGSPAERPIKSQTASRLSGAGSTLARISQ